MGILENIQLFFGRVGTTQTHGLYNIVKAETEIVNPLILPQPYSTQQYEINQWKQAVTLATRAEDPVRTQLYDMYDSVMIDLHVSTVLESRILPVKRAAFQLVSKVKKELILELESLLDMNWFEDFLEYAIESRFYGYSLVELSQLTLLDQTAYVTLIPRAHVNSIKNLIYLERGDDDKKGISYIEELSPYYIGIGKEKDLGFLFKITPVILAKKQALSMWAEFNEKMVIPFRTLKTPSRDKKRHQLLGEILRRMGSAGWAVLNDDEMLELTEMSGKDAYKAFETLIERIDNSITRYILGQTGTTNQDTTGTYGSLKVLEGIAENRHETDKAFIRRLVNTELLPRLALFGHKTKDVLFVWNNNKELNLIEKIDIINKLNVNYLVDAKYVQNETGIPLTARQNEPLNVQNVAKKKNEFLNFPRYRIDPQLIVDFVKNDALENDLIEQAWDGKLTHFDPAYYEWLSGNLKQGVEKGFKSSLNTIEYSKPDHSLHALLEANIYRFSAAKDVATVLQINELVKSEKNYHDFKTKAKELLKTVNERYLQTEYDMALGNSMQAANYLRMVEDKDVFPYWEYVTSGKDNVREAHRKLNGMVFAADDPAFNTIMPKNGWKCNCEVRKHERIPKGKTVSKESDALGVLQSTVINKSGKTALDDMKKQGFAVNRAKIGVIFTENQLYVKKFDDAKFGIKTMYGHDRFTLKNLNKEQFKEHKPTLTTNQEAKDYLLKQTNANGDVVLKDYTNRPFALSTETINSHLSNSEHYKERFKVAEALPEILKEADEVWLRKYKSYHTFTYVKFYKKEALTVIAHVKNGKPLEIKTFFELNADAESGHRSGLLIKKLK